MLPRPIKMYVVYGHGYGVMGEWLEDVLLSFRRF